MPVYLYLIGQREVFGHDTFSSAVVSANTEEYASHIHPNGLTNGWGADNCEEHWRKDRSWVDHPSKVEVQLIGVADGSVPNNCVLLTSFHAG